MRILTILGHPDAGSFNHAIATRLSERLKAEGHDVRFHDLYAEGYDPLLRLDEAARDCQLSPSVQSHCDEITEADGLIIVHPNWWGAPPAIVKGWVDRTFRAGLVYQFVDRGDGVGVPEGMLKADRALVINTANSAPSADWGAVDPLEAWWRSTVLGMCGVSQVHRRLYAPVITAGAEMRETWLREAEELAAQVFSGAQCPV